MILSTWSWSGDIIENKANTTTERLNKRFEILTFQKTNSIQKYILSCDCRSKTASEV